MLSVCHGWCTHCRFDVGFKGPEGLAVRALRHPVVDGGSELLQLFAGQRLARSEQDPNRLSQCHPLLSTSLRASVYLLLLSILTMLVRPQA